MIIDCVPIWKGQPYTGPNGNQQTADTDGLLLVQTGQIICAERLASVLGQLGGWKVRQRKQG